jgi:hypothetical protein
MTRARESGTEAGVGLACGSPGADLSPAHQAEAADAQPRFPAHDGRLLDADHRHQRLRKCLAIDDGQGECALDMPETDSFGS